MILCVNQYFAESKNIRTRNDHHKIEQILISLKKHRQTNKDSKK